MAELREREIQRTEDMRKAKISADDANQAKSAFLAVVSHEIRTPMTGILGMVRLLMDTKLNKKQYDYVLAVQKSGDTMMALLNDILDFEKIEHGNMELEEIDFDLVKLVQGVVTLMSGHAAAKNIVLKDDIPNDFPRFLIGDPTRLRQILLNLVSNAIKFTHEGHVTIRLKSTPILEKNDAIQQDYEIYFGVEDTGIGIPEKTQDNLFSPFAQADKTVSRHYGGTGLGLAICKRLVEAMGNAIHVSSEDGEGSTFFFSLLMFEGDSDSAQSYEQGHSAESTSKMRGLNILIVEDNEMNQRVLEGFLAKNGHILTVCDSAEDGLQIIENREGAFDVVLMDINLNGMSGVDAVKILRASPNSKLSALPVVALTGNVMPDDLATYEESGINEFLAKPINPESLDTVLNAVMNGRRPVNVAHFNRDQNHSAQSPLTFKARAVSEENLMPSDYSEAEKDSVARDTPLEAPPSNTIETEPNAPASLPASFENEIAPLAMFAKSFSEDTTGQDMITKDKADRTLKASTFEHFGETDEDDFDSFAEAADHFEHKAQNEKFDYTMLKGLLENLGADAMRGLLESYTEKAEELCAAIATENDRATLKDRAHELKGMAGNFGMLMVSEHAARLERAAKDRRESHDYTADKAGLLQAHEDSESALKVWIKENGI